MEKSFFKPLCLKLIQNPIGGIYYLHTMINFCLGIILNIPSKLQNYRLHKISTSSSNLFSIQFSHIFRINGHTK